MKPNVVLSIVLILFFIPVSVIAQQAPIVIPHSGDWTIDGEVSENEWAGVLDIPLGALPLRAFALHDGEALYLAFEVATPESSWEAFAVWDDGDGVFYEEDDHMTLCDESGCRICSYQETYTYECPSGLVSAVNEGISELEVTIELVGTGQVIFGVILDGVEHLSQPFDVELGPITPISTQPVEQPVAPVITEPLEDQPEEVVSTLPPSVATEPVEDRVMGKERDLPGWVIPLIAGVLGLVALIVLLMLLGKGKPKPDPCEEWYHMVTEDVPDGYIRSAKAQCDNGKAPDVDPKKASLDRIKDGIKDLEDQPQSEERDKKIKELQEELASRERRLPETAVVPSTEGANLSVTVQGVPENVPTTVEWQAETVKGEQTVGTGGKTQIPPGQMQQIRSNSPSPGVVIVRAKITICPGTPQEVTIYSNTVQIVTE